MRAISIIMNILILLRASISICLKVYYLILLRASISICLKVYYFLQETEIENSPIFLAWLFHDGVFYHIETNPLICFTNQCTGFYIIETSLVKELIRKKIFQKANSFKIFQ